MFPHDPDVEVIAARVLDLYEGRWNGVRLGPQEYVISCDEKTSIQARMTRVNHAYDRGGAVANVADYDVGRARVFGRCAPSTGIVPFLALVEQVMTHPLYASAKRVFFGGGQRVVASGSDSDGSSRRSSRTR